MTSAASRPIHRFYTTDLSPCPYLLGRQERRLVALLEAEQGNERLDLLTEAGFRRSQGFLYKPVCPGCRACVPVRIVVGTFKPRRSFRRVQKRNADLSWEERPATSTDEQYDLFHRYLQHRHHDGGMVRMDREAYREMVEMAPASSRVIEFRDPERRLVGVSLTDRLRSGLSGVYKFFAPELEPRSLGTFIILWHIDRARALGLPYVYLGYWIRESRKMAYKARFAPLEQLDGPAWRPLAPEEAQPAGPSEADTPQAGRGIAP
jgi:arginyl-tRNA--protein-N-Asp/Glu arginylyltransferase